MSSPETSSTPTVGQAITVLIGSLIVLTLGLSLGVLTVLGAIAVTGSFWLGIGVILLIWLAIGVTTNAVKSAIEAANAR